MKERKQRSKAGKENKDKDHWNRMKRIGGRDNWRKGGRVEGRAAAFLKDEQKEQSKINGSCYSC